MKITIGSDHGAVDLKEEIKLVLKEMGDVEVKDVGTFGTESAVRFAPMYIRPGCQESTMMRMYWLWAAGLPDSGLPVKSSVSG